MTKALFGERHDETGDRTWLVLLAACVVLLVWKAWTIWRLNVNWDEFYFLTHVHALLRGDLAISFQTAYAQLFRWLPWVGDTELPQIHAARLVMLALLVLTVVQITRLAARWVSPGAAMVAALAFLCALPTQRHGASFRVDSMLVPLLLGAILLLTRPRQSRRADIGAGVLCGVGIAMSAKMALFAPLLVACVFLSDSAGMRLSRLRSGAIRCLLIGAVTLVVAATLIALHQLTLEAPPAESAVTFADRAVGKTILETTFVPAVAHLRNLVREDWLVWALIALGGTIALYRRRWQMAALVLALLPILFYRNAFPYFYVVMLAPPVVLTALVVEELRALVRRRQDSSMDAWVPTVCGAMLALQGAVRLPLLSYDEQQNQREVLRAVHAIFPHAVPYIDHCGMVATFHKVNIFMSTWGMEDYRRHATPFVVPALRAYRPPLLVVTRAFLDPRLPQSQALLPEDRELIERLYQPYWGPIFIAGARAELVPGETLAVELPFPGSYRVVSDEPVVIDGLARSQGDVVDIAGTSVSIVRRLPAADSRSLVVQLLWADARSPPSQSPGPGYLFTPL